MSHEIASADALLQELARLLAALLAELDTYRTALDAIGRHVIGACESAIYEWPDPCDECGEMREIAAQARKAHKKATDRA